MGLQSKTRSVIEQGIRNRTPFVRGNVSGRHISYLGDTGRLPSEYAERFREGVSSGHITYAAYSYGTPIAWFHDVYGWVQPGVKYSVTTTQHQNVVGYAITRSERVTNG